MSSGPTITDARAEFLFVAVFAVVFVVGLAVPTRIIRLFFNVRLTTFVERSAIAIAIPLVGDVIPCRPIVPGLVALAVIHAIVAGEKSLARLPGRQQSRPAQGHRPRQEFGSSQDTPIGAPAVGYSVTLSKMRLVSRPSVPRCSGTEIPASNGVQFVDADRAGCDAAAHFKCCHPVLDPVFATSDEKTPGGIIIAGALMGLQVCFERRAPTLAEGQA